MKAAGLQHPIETMLLANAVDALNLLCWMNSEDGHKGRNRPESVTSKLLGEDQKSKGNYESYGTIDDFLKARAKIIGGGADAL